MFHKISKFLQTLILTLVIGLGVVVGSQLTNISTYAGSENPYETPNQNYYPNYVPIAPIVIDKTKIEPLSPLFNSDKTKNRINMLFYRSDPAVNITELKTVISKALKDTKPVNYYTGDYGVFDIEPFRSNMDTFNFWFYTESVPTAKDFDFRELVRKNSTLTGLDFVSTILVEKRLPFNIENTFGSRDNAVLPLMIYTPDKTLIEYLPGSITLYFDTSYTNTDNSIEKLTQTTLAHELGHSIFGLLDEYVEFGRLVPSLAYPNCASSSANGQSWWGDYIDQVDPFFYEYRDNYITGKINSQDSWLRYEGAQLQERVFDPQDPGNITAIWKNITKDDLINPEEFRITNNNRGGCFAGYDNRDAWRPSQNSIMNNDFRPIFGSNSIMNNDFRPIFGSYNRAVSQKVLDLFNKPIPPTKPKQTLEFYTNIKNFQREAISPASCQVIIQGDKKNLNCTFENQNNLMSDKVVMSYGLREYNFESDNSDDEDAIIKQTTKLMGCKLVNGVSKFDCQGLDISSLDVNKEYIIWLDYNATGEFGLGDDIYDGRAGGSNFSLKNSKTGISQGEFKLTSLETITAPEIKPITTLTPTLVSTQVSTPITAIQKTNTNSPVVTRLSKTGANLSIILSGAGLLALSLILVTITFFTKKKKLALLNKL